MTPRGDNGARRRPARSMVLLRQVPGDTVVHRLWAGTKLLGAVAIGIVLTIAPSWIGILVGTALVLGVGRLARIPASAVPRPPKWFWAVMAVGALVTLASGGRPEVAVAGGHLGFGHAELYLRFVCLSVVLLGASLLVGWTTALGDIAPAIARLGRPLRRLRVPVDEWAVTVALCVRSLPLLVEELRVLVAARRLRPRPPGRRTVDATLDELVDLLTAALAASIRRAGEMGEAITARGGVGQLTANPGRPRRPDVVALVVVGVACAAAAWLPAL